MKPLKLAAHLCHLFAAALLLLFLYQAFTPESGLTAGDRLLFAAAIAFLLALGTALSVRIQPDRRAFLWKRCLWLLFGFYLWNLVSVLFFDSYFGRGAIPSGFQSVNLIPFRTISHYLLSSMLASTILINLLGNLCAFAPLGLFLPLLFPRLRTFLRYFLTVGLSVLLVELLQVLTGLGIGDVDDWLLNVAGALLLHGFCRLLPVSRLLGRVTALL